MSIFHSVVLGILEGVTEFLPISSTGHLVLFSRLLQIPQTEFLKTFEISIQLGAILSVVFLYGRTLLVKAEVLKRIFLAFLPTALLGLIFYKIIKSFLMESETVIVYSLLLGGVFLILFEYFYQEKKEDTDKIENMPLKQAFFIGIFQSIAMIPGVSRSASTIIGGLILGVKRKTIVEFSFLLAIPTMFAATGLDLLKNYQEFSSANFTSLAVGFVISFLVAILSIKFLLNFVKKHNFTSFGIYRIILAIIFLIFVL